jgi:hypothetical protein
MTVSPLPSCFGDVAFFTPLGWPIKTQPKGRITWSVQGIPKVFKCVYHFINPSKSKAKDF